jgi:hypothetical protein
MAGDNGRLMSDVSVIRNLALPDVPSLAEMIRAGPASAGIERPFTSRAPPRTG